MTETETEILCLLSQSTADSLHCALCGGELTLTYHADPASGCRSHLCSGPWRIGSGVEALHIDSSCDGILAGYCSHDSELKKRRSITSF